MKTLPKKSDLFSQTSLPRRFENRLKAGGLIRPSDKVFVACSGGSDSTALFYLFVALREKWKLKLGLLHFDHGLRPGASVRDAEFVRKLAKKFKVPFYSAHSRGLKKAARQNRFSLEEAARLARYNFFEKAAKEHKIPKVALAHTLDDQAETVLMRLVRGTGLRGLSGIRRSLKGRHTVFVRPLLEFQKKELLGWMKKEKISFRIDATNRQTHHERNKIRLFFLPWLARQINPRAAHALARIPALAQEENDLILQLEDKIWPQVLHSRQEAERMALKKMVFMKAHPALQFRLLERALRTLDRQSGLDHDAWQKVRPGLSRKAWCVSLPKDIDLAVTHSKIILYKKNKS